MLEDARFVRWAEEALVPLVAHNELLHEEEKVVVDGEEVRRCSLYPGLACRDHVRAAVDVDNAREDHLVQVPFVELCPNSWLVLPTGAVERIEEKDQFTAKAVRRQVEAVQKRLGKPLAAEVLEPVRRRLDAAEAACEDERWRDALEALAAVAEHVPEPHASLAAWIDRLRSEVDEWVAFEAEEALEREDPSAADRALVARLLQAVDVAVFGEHVPVRERLRTWQARHVAGTAPSRTDR